MVIRRLLRAALFTAALTGAAWCAQSFSPAPAYAIPGIGGADNSASGDAAGLSPDQGKSLEELLEEARGFMRSGHPIDARAKLQQAIRIAPNDYQAYMLLGQYYLFEVAHFKLAYRYLKTAETHFSRQYGSDLNGTLDDARAPEHAMLLYLISEAELNLDKYQDSLNTLDRFERRYWLDWYPGTRAWVLMKLKRIDDAIQVAQAGLLRDADPRRTWNILGILLSLKGNRELSLQAFREAIKAELTLRGAGMVATPLNNAGEVYREMFQDKLAEAAWLRAIQLPDGCDHVLPSLNLSHLYIDETRLFQAARTLQDFESCFLSNSERKDSEHRTLLALARGKIALHENRLEDAAKLVSLAVDDQQWFGKIGTNENDVRFAATNTLARVLYAQAAALRDRAHESLTEAIKTQLQIPYLRIRAWWLNRKARRIGLEELDDLEDLFIRNTDSMLEYPTLGNLFADVPTRSFRKRIERMIEKDTRPHAHIYYRSFLAANLLAHGEAEEAEAILRSDLQKLRPIDRLLRVEMLSKLELAERAQDGMFSGPSEQELQESMVRREEVFQTLPSALRFNDLALPVTLTLVPGDEESRDLLEEIGEELTSVRFAPVSAAQNPRYGLVLASAPGETPEQRKVTVTLVDRLNNGQRSVESKPVLLDGEGRAELINAFIDRAFAHQIDPPSEPAPPLPLIEGVL